MKKYILLFLAALFCSCTLYAEASEGSVEIIVPEETEFEFTYTKVGEVVNGEFVLTDLYKESGVDLNHLKNGGDMSEAVAILQKIENHDKVTVSSQNGIVQIHGVDAGVYLIEGVENEEYEILAFLVSVPVWSEEEGDVSNQITVIPKIVKTPEVVATGDRNQIAGLSALCILSLVIVLGLSGNMCFGFREN